MYDLVEVRNEEIFTTSKIIAEGTGNKHHAIQQFVIRQIKRCLFRQIKTGLSEHLTMG